MPPTPTLPSPPVKWWAVQVGGVFLETPTPACRTLSFPPAPSVLGSQGTREGSGWEEEGKAPLGDRN